LIDDPNAKDILSILTDEPSLKIMNLLDKREFSTQNISLTLNIPLSSTYRKVKKLEQLNIIKTTKVVRTLDGLDESFYTLSIKEINVTYKRNKFLFNIQQKALDDKIVRLWQKFKN
jgi:predicted transcriptional regulator